MAASQQFISDVDLVQYGLQYSTSFTEKLSADVQSIQKYEALVTADLGLPPSLSRPACSTRYDTRAGACRS